VKLDPAAKRIDKLNPLALSAALNPVEVSAGITISTKFPSVCNNIFICTKGS